MAINNPIVTDSEWLQATAVAIQNKDGGSKMGVPDFASRIEAIPTPVEKKDVNFYDWEGTLLFGYSVEEVQAMTSLPAPDTSPNYQSVDHDLLTFQEWTRNLTNIKTWVQNHSNQSLGVGAIYTTTDGQNHDYLNNPRLTNIKSIYMQKRGVALPGSAAFRDCYSLAAINIPGGLTAIANSAFKNCYSFTAINIPDGVTSIRSNAFQNCRELYDVVIHGKPVLSDANIFSGAPSTQKLYVHRSDLSWFETETNWSTIYAQGKIVAAADYLEHLISIGIDVTDFENEVISE